MNARTPRPPETRTRPWWRPDFVPVGAVTLVLAVAVAIAGYRWLGSEAALRYVVADIVARSGGKLAVEDVGGSLVDAVRIRSLRYTDGGRELSADDLLLRWTPMALLSGRLHLSEFRLRHLELRWPSQNETPLVIPASLALPLTIECDRFSASTVTVGYGKERATMIDLSLRYRGDAREHRVDEFAVQTQLAALSGDARVSANAPYAVAATIALRGGPSLHDAALALSITGTAAAMEVVAKGVVAGAQTSARVRYAPFEAERLVDFAIDVRELEFRRIDARLPPGRLDATIDGRGQGGGGFSGSVAAINRQVDTVDRHGLPVESLRSRYVLAGSRLSLSEIELRLPAGATIAGSGWVGLASPPSIGDSEWDLVARRVDLRGLHTALATTELSGPLHLRVAQGRPHVSVDLAQDDMAFAASASIDAAAITVGKFRARARGGEMAGRAAFSWMSPRRFSLDAQATRLDPSRLGAFPQASLDGHVQIEGVLDPSWRVTGNVAVAEGSRWKGLAFSGSIRGTLTDAQASDAIIDVRLADGRVRATGSFGRPGDRFRYQLDLPRLGRMAPVFGDHWPAGLDGAIVASGHVEGSLQASALAVEAQGRDLAWRGWRIGTLRVTASTRAPARWPAHEAAITVAMESIAAGRSRYARARVQFEGTAARHVLAATVEGEGLAAAATLAGGLGGAARTISPFAWSGSLTRFGNSGLHPIELLAPARLEIRWPDLEIRDARASVADGRLDLHHLAWQDGRLATQGSFTGVPVGTVARLAGLPLPPAATLVMGGDWNIATSPRLNGRVRLHRERGDLVFGTGSPAGLPALDLGLSLLDVEADIANDRVDARALLRGTRLGALRANLRVDVVPGAPAGTLSSSAPLEASIEGELASLRPLQPWIGTSAIVDGKLSLAVTVSGTLTSPRARGTLSASNVRVDAPRYGLHWRDGRATARLTDDFVILDEYSIAAGEGRLTLAGKIPLGAIRERSKELPAAALAWTAERFRVANRPDLRIVASGGGTAGFRNGEVVLQGRLQIEEGRIDIEKSPGTTPGDDVVVVGRPTVERRGAAEAVPATVDLRVDIGRRVRVTGQGIDATLEGSLRVMSGPRGAPWRAQGTIQTVSGTYLAFGQRLEIERGRATFDGPIENPALDLTAVRKNLPVEPGIVVSGTVRLPNVRLISNPPQSEGDKLSWLVLGQGLDRTSGADLGALQAAAGALFGSGGPAIGARIAQSVGFDDLALRSAASAQRGGSSQLLALSKRLSDRIYMVFEQGLTAANTALRLEYALTQTLTLRARVGAVSGLGLVFHRSLE